MGGMEFLTLLVHHGIHSGAHESNCLLHRLSGVVMCFSSSLFKFTPNRQTGALELHGAAAAAANQIPAEIWYMMVPGKGGDMPQMSRGTPLTSQLETRERPGAALAV